MASPTYDPTVFNVASERQAKDIILTPEAGMTPDERWEKETPDVFQRMVGFLEPPTDAPSVILDWGCGIGRLAKPLCEWGVHVVGVDISPDMRRLARYYVGDEERFRVVAPAVYEEGAGSSTYACFDAAVAT